jgi:hypothetical protein
MINFSIAYSIFGFSAPPALSLKAAFGNNNFEIYTAEPLSLLSLLLRNMPIYVNSKKNRLNPRCMFQLIDCKTPPHERGILL